MGHGTFARDPVMGERWRVLDLDSEKDPQILRQAAKLLVRENERLTDKVVALMSENLALKGASPADLQLRLAQLEAQLAVKNKLLFGKSSEKRPVERAEAAPDKRPQVGHGPREQPALPVVEKLFALDEADLGCPKCGKTLAAFAGQFEESEEITVVERRFVVVKQKRQKYRCECNGCIETAPGPMKLFPGARYSVDFAVEVGPLASTSTTSRWSGRCGPWRARGSSWTPRRSGIRSTCSAGGSSRHRAHCSRECSRNPSSDSIRRAGGGSMARATSRGRCGA